MFRLEDLTDQYLLNNPPVKEYSSAFTKLVSTLGLQADIVLESQCTSKVRFDEFADNHIEGFVARLKPFHGRALAGFFTVPSANRETAAAV